MGSISPPPPPSPSDSYTVNNLTITPFKKNSSFGAEVAGLDFNTVPFSDSIIKTVFHPLFYLSSNPYLPPASHLLTIPHSNPHPSFSH